VDSLRQFITKDTGTTHIIFNYKGFRDTAFIYIGSASIEGIVNTCSFGNVSFYAGTNDINKTYKWQIDSTNGFEDIIPNAVFSGVNSPTLTLTGAPSSLYNSRYRCLISDAIGETSSQIFTLRFAITWTGTSDNTWENPANWSCGSLPDENTDVFIYQGKPHYPQVNTNISCRSLKLQNGTSVLVKTGNRIDIKGKNE
jgi:hypothetical protein